MAYRVGEWAGPYRLLQLVGRGTFGEVFLARHREDAHHVALKTVAYANVPNEPTNQAHEAALAEARLLLRLRHPHVVHCEDMQMDPTNGAVWLALEFMDGGDVQHLIDDRRQTEGPPFAAHFVRRVLSAIGSALQYIHSQDILHRDVKPANVLMTRRSQRIKLADFGISKLLQATASANTVVGTPYYLSPEIVSGQKYGTAADAWALGVCLYELAALRRPFEASNPLALVRRICEAPPPELPSETAEDITIAICGLLEKDTKNRKTLSDALGVSAAVAALVPCASLESSLQICTPRDRSPLSRGELSPVSVVTESSCLSSPRSFPELPENTLSVLREKATELTLSELSVVREALQEHTALPGDASQAVNLARAALSSEVDDPEELQLALHALQTNAPATGETHAEVFQSLSSEVKLRLSALHADASAHLQSLLDELAPPEDVNPEESIEDKVHVSASIVKDVTDLETAIELATSLGVDTEPAEAQAASVRRMLSVRAVWGVAVRFFLLPLDASFDSLTLEVARRFGFPFFGGGTSDMRLRLRQGVALHDQASWETCLRRCGLHQKPGRVELQVETPFVVTGTRLQSMPSANVRPTSGVLGPEAICGNAVASTALPPPVPRAAPPKGRIPGGLLPRPACRIPRSCAWAPPGPRGPAPALISPSANGRSSAAAAAAAVAVAASASAAAGAGWGSRGSRSTSAPAPAAPLRLEGRSANVRRGGRGRRSVAGGCCRREDPLGNPGMERSSIPRSERS